MSKWMAGAAVIGAVLGGTSLVSASIPNTDDTVTACVSRGGAIRIIDPEITACKTGPASQAEDTLVLSGPVPPPPPPLQVAVVSGAPSEQTTVAPVGIVRLTSMCPEGSVPVGRTYLNRLTEVIVDGLLDPRIDERSWEIFGDAEPGRLLPEGVLRAICLTNVIDATDAPD